MKSKYTWLPAIAVLLAALTVFLHFGMFAAAYTPGDLNGDGKVNSVDARTALRMAARLYEGTAEEKIACDVNADGKVTSADARLILCVAARIYDTSYFKVVTSHTVYYDALSTTATTQSGRQNTVRWDEILPTTTTRVYAPVSTTKRVHPDNYNTRPTVPPTTATTVPVTTVAPPEVGTVPTSPVAITTTSPVVTTALPVDPMTLPRFSIHSDASDDGLVTLTLTAHNVKSLRGGNLSLNFDPTVLEYVSAENYKADGGTVYIAPFYRMGVICCEFSMATPLREDTITFGTVTFRVKDGGAYGTSVSLSVMEPVSYNWNLNAGSALPTPGACYYYIFLHDGNPA
ncbi:MAG: hypothetical protein IJ766_01525 [Clostridia bacterium]|nr:hypothetical protein [Clostridia bacterium]